jgi:hypothetical protein
MRATVGLLAISGLFSAQAIAQEALTFDFGGRAGIGWLNTETASNTPVGFSYEGLVLRAEGTGTLDFAVSDSFSIGAVARLSLQKGQHANYELVRPFPSSALGSKFDSQDTDVALYASLGPVTLSFGEMQTAFELATRKVEHGASILDGGNAVWQAIGDASGSLGSVDSNSQGPGEPKDFTTVRADIAVSDFVFSVSQSRQSTFSTFFDTDTTVRSSGVTWQRDIGEGNLFVGMAYDRGPSYKFRSASVGWAVGGLTLVVSQIDRRPLQITSALAATYELEYLGWSATYDLGDYSLGFASASQENPYGLNTFSGDAQAFWVGWAPRENVSVDFEVSKNDYRDSTSQDTRKASLAVSYSF